MPTRTKSYGAWLQEKLVDPATAANYLNAAMNESREMFLVALRKVSEANRMAVVAEKANISRESLYRTLSEKGNPELSTLSGVLKALGLRITIEPAG